MWASLNNPQQSNDVPHTIDNIAVAVPPCTRNNVRKNTTIVNGPIIAAKTMALIGKNATSLISVQVKVVGKPQYSNKPTTCPITSIPHSIINFRRQLRFSLFTLLLIANP